MTPWHRKPRTALLAVAIAAAALSFTACKRSPSPGDEAAAPSASQAPDNETADQFIARVNREMRETYTELSSAQWLSSTYINSDSELVAAKANERWLTQLNGWIEQSRKFEGTQMSADTARAMSLLKLMTSMPAPHDPATLAEVSRIAT